MPKYDSEHFVPAAPVVSVALRDVNGGAVFSDVSMLMDTGADITLVPRSAIEHLRIKPLEGITYELVGVDGTKTPAEAVEIDMIFLNKIFRSKCLLIDDDYCILGRDVLASLVLILNGPQQEWSQQGN